MDLKVIVLLVVLLVGTVSGANLAPNASEVFRVIVDAVAAAEARERTGEDYFAEEKVCFADIGCFTKSGPMRHTGIFPEPIAKIGTHFTAFSSATAGHLVDPHKPATFGTVNAGKKIVFVTHGFMSSGHDLSMVTIKNHLLANTNQEVGTVIVVDWEHGAVFPHYNEASTNTQVVGRQIAHLVNELHKHHNVNPGNVYLVGHSLGAQVSGFAGKFSQSEYHWKFGRITGLDAASPMFEGRAGAFLSRTDAIFVDAIHTSVGLNIAEGELGFGPAYAHLDFYPNGGNKQPGCGLGWCGHNRAVLYYQHSLAAHATGCHFSGFACANYATFTAPHKTCTKSDVEMGYWADRGHVHGIRYLTTGEHAPFCH